MYSQNDEEQVILDYFLDIGAYNGKTFSNTHQLALNGWSGVCVEASSKPFSDLIKLYKDNDKIELVNACIIADTEDPRFLTQFFDSGGDATSTTDKLSMEKWNTHSTFRRVFMPPIHFSSIERSFGSDYDFVNIDVEGTNIDLALGMSFENTQLLCIEHDSDYARCEQIAEVWGFEEIHRNGENIIYARKKDGQTKNADNV
jgi:FkbM family methyltransferase